VHDPQTEAALRALVDQVRAGRIKRLGLERVDGEPAFISPLAALLLALGFHEGPRRMTLSA
jgi:ATP-dependent Lhr-like helicase